MRTWQTDIHSLCVQIVPCFGEALHDASTRSSRVFFVTHSCIFLGAFFQISRPKASENYNKNVKNYTRLVFVVIPLYGITIRREIDTHFVLRYFHNIIPVLFKTHDTNYLLYIRPFTASLCEGLDGATSA